MASRHGRIALQLTQWVGGTIIVLMFIFVLADYLIQHRYFAHSMETSARLRADGLKSLLQSGQTLDEIKAKLADADTVAGYMENQETSIAVFDVAGNVIWQSAGALPTDPAESEKLSRAPSEAMEIRHLKIGGIPIVAAVTAFETKEDTPTKGFVAYIHNASETQQMGLLLWGWRSAMILVIIIGVMLAVRIPVKRFVVAPIDGLFLAAYAVSRDDYQRVPACPVDNEFAELYEMFGRMMGHLSDTRTQDGQPPADEQEGMLPEPQEEPVDKQPAE
jgi:hypothetical protein